MPPSRWAGSVGHPAIAMGAWAIWDASNQPDTDFTTIADISGNNRTANQAATAGTPPHSTTANGLPAFEIYAGSGAVTDGFSYAPSPLRSGVDFEVWMALKTGWPGGNAAIFMDIGTENDGFNSGVLYLAGNNLTLLRGGSFSGASQAVMAPQPSAPSGTGLNVWRYRGLASTNSSYLQVDSNTEISLADTRGAQPSEKVCVGYITSSLGTLGAAPMAVGEVIIFTRALTTAEAASLQTYLKTKWGAP